MRIGSAQISSVLEVTVAYAPDYLFKGLPEAYVPRHREQLPAWSVDHDGERICLTFQSFLVRHAGRTILVDSCNGNHKNRPEMPRWHRTDFPYLQRLAQAGVRPEDVDFVLCSHLHADHVGWNTRLDNGRWVPTFPNARYLVSDVELAHWARLHEADPATPLNHGAYQDSVLPVVEAGLVDAIPVDHVVSHDIDTHLALEPAPGHTPGHVHLLMRSRGRECIYCADTLHHPLQVADPHYGLVDGDARQAEQTRRLLLERAAGSGATLLPAHFAAAGSIRETRGLFRFHPESA